ncbi:hypothetical protein BH20VER1_BH20VER1_14000 [soil metagenome]
MASPPAPPEVCPVCGEGVPRNARACPKCGADHRSGWRDDAAIYDGVDVEEEQFDYDEFVQKEFGGGSARKPQVPIVWTLTAILLLVAMAMFLLLR